MAGNDLGSLLGGLLGGGGQGGTSGGDILASLLGALMKGQGGGSGNPLGGLMDMLAKSGLSEQAQSWVGTGENQPVSGEQVAQALPGDALDNVATEAGVTPEQAADQIAQTLPQAVDKLTPGGELPQAGASLEDLIRQQSL